MEIKYLFVYGTLRYAIASKMHDVLKKYYKYFSDGFLNGMLFEIQGYPGFVESDDASKKVYGELYEILSSDELFALLDEYEECSDRFPEPHDYIRKKLPISLVNSDKVTAWVYVYTSGVTDLIQIESGDYVTYSKVT